MHGNFPGDAAAHFQRFVAFFCTLFSEPDPLASADCRDSFKEYVPRYYRDWFGPNVKGVTSRHLKWFRRLSPVFSLPHGSSVLDFGGGYGLDSIFLASLGYKVTFYEVSIHHIGVAKALAARYAEQFGPLDITFVHARRDPLPTGLDAVVLDEVAHHIEPVEDVFDTAARMLKPGGSLFLLEPNFLSAPVQIYFFRVRGFKVVGLQWDIETGEVRPLGREHIRTLSDWVTRAGKFGFQPQHTDYVVPWLIRHAQPSRLRRMVEQAPLLRDLAATHVTVHFAKNG